MLTDEGPEIGEPEIGAASIAVDEDDIPTVVGNAGGVDDLADADVSFSGTLSNFDYGIDGPGDVVLTAVADTGLTTLAGNAVKTVWDGVNHVLTGKDAVTDDDVFTLTLTEDSSGNPTGDYTFALLAPVAHAAGLNENNETFSIDVTITDKEGESDSSHINVLIEDDGPSITVSTTEDTESQLLVDETDLSVNDTKNFAGSFTNGTPDAGADGQSGTVVTTYTLGITADTDSGLVDTATGEKVILSVTAGGVVEGRTETSNDLVFTVSATNTGDVTLDQVRAMVNPISPDNHDEPISLSDELITLTREDTITDRDGDTAKDDATLEIGANLTFEDDGPTITNPQDAILTNEIGNVLTGADLGIDFGADGAAAVAAIALTPEVGTNPSDTDTFGFAINSDGDLLTSTVDGVTYNLVYVQNTVDGSVTAYQADVGTTNPSSVAVFTLTPDVATGTYSVSIVGQLDGQAFTTGNVIDSANAVGGGNDEILLYNVDDLYVLATARTVDDNTIATVNHATAHGLSVSQDMEVNKDVNDTLILHFADSDIGAKDWDGDGIGTDLDSDDLNATTPTQIEAFAADVTNAVYLTEVTFELSKWKNGDEAEWTVFKDGADVTPTNNTLSYANGDSFTISVAGGFNEIHFTAPAGGYAVKSMYVDNTEDFAAVDHTINVGVTATDGDGDVVYESSTLEVTFDGDGVIEGTASDEAIDYTSTTSIDGGDGFDTLMLSDGISLDFSDTNIADIENIEAIDLSSNSTLETISLSLTDVLDMTDANNELTIKGDDIDGDHVIITNDLDIGTNPSQWVDNGSVTDNGIVTFNYSTNNGMDSLTLTVDEDIYTMV